MEAVIVARQIQLESAPYYVPRSPGTYRCGVGPELMYLSGFSTLKGKDNCSCPIYTDIVSAAIGPYM